MPARGKGGDGLGQQLAQWVIRWRRIAKLCPL